MTDAEQRIADLERELARKDERIAELRDEVDEGRELMHRMEEHVQERDEYLEAFCSTFGLELNSDGKWTNGAFIERHNRLCDAYSDLLGRYNKLVVSWNRGIADKLPVGRPVAASEAQQERVRKLHKAGHSSRWIAEELTLSRRTVTTILDKDMGADRTSQRHRKRLGLEPVKKDWRRASMDRLPKAATKLRAAAADLLQEAKGLR